MSKKFPNVGPAIAICTPPDPNARETDWQASHDGGYWVSIFEIMAKHLHVPKPSTTAKHSRWEIRVAPHVHHAVAQQTSAQRIPLPKTIFWRRIPLVACLPNDHPSGFELCRVLRSRKK